MAPVRALCVVAHPDDCVIFARPFVDNFPAWHWHIVYLTYTDRDPRAREMRAYWDRRNTTTDFLGFQDDYADQLAGELKTWRVLDAAASISLAIKQFAPDLILTHYEDGDYGHIHHKFVNQTVQVTNSIAKVYFASTFNYNVEYFAQEALDLAQFPLHAEVIAGFQDRDHGRYILTPEAEKLINENTNT